jgi:hypothetical protein
MRVGPTARGWLIILAIAGLITALSLEPGLALLIILLQIAFLVAIAFALYRLWRQRRGEIEAWSTRARTVFYGAACLALVNVIAGFLPFLDWPSGGLEALVFFGVLAACVFAMWRVWRDEHTYGY